MSLFDLHQTDLGTLQYIITHVFLPLRLPDGDDCNIVRDHFFTRAVVSAAELYRSHLDSSSISEWDSIVGMLDNLHATVQFGSLGASQTIYQLSNMNIGDIRAFLIRAQNAAIVFRKKRNVTIVESFEVSPNAEDVMASQGKLICSYPGPAIEIPATIFEDENFLSELVNFLVHMSKDTLDSAPTSRKAHSAVLETRDTAHPRYVTELLTGILRSVGSPADVTRISKRIGDDVAWNNSELPWRRSSLWLLIRVSLQTSLEQSSLGSHTYKAFMLFFMCSLTEAHICTDLPNELLQAMTAKLSRRLQKLGPSAPNWLSCTVQQACTSLRSILEKRWRQVLENECATLPWVPSQLDLVHDVQLSLLGSADYLSSSLASRSIPSSSTHFSRTHHCRGTLDNFLPPDDFFEEAYQVEPYVALYDVERAIEEEIDAWVGGISDIDDACIQLVTLADKYTSRARKTYGDNPELLSVMLLTTIELWIALDKIATKKAPMLVEYSPEVPIGLLEDLLLYRKGNFDRLRRAHQYLANRHSSCKRGWSVFSQTVTTDSFSVRFYSMSSQLQDLKARIEKAAEEEARKKRAELEKVNARHAELELMIAKADHDDEMKRPGKKCRPKKCTKCRYKKELRGLEIAVHEWPLPEKRLHAEAVVFELNCPVFFDMWRTAMFHLLVDICTPSVERHTPYIKLHDYMALRCYSKQHSESRVTLASDSKPVASTHYQKIPLPATPEQVCVKNGMSLYGFDNHASILVSGALGRENIKQYCTHRLQSGSYQTLQKYVDTTSHTSNEVMAGQVDCHSDMSIHEFIAFGHLRSGGLVQWLNILRELRGRSLTFHHQEVHLLLAQAVSQVGPYVNTEWMWHQELGQPAFSNALLEELERLLQDVQANWLEAVTMNTISFLLRRLLASCSDQTLLQRLLQLLFTVRSRVFCWVQELSSRLMTTPDDDDFRGLLRDAAIICRGTFDVDPATIPTLLQTQEDIKMLLSCAILIHHHTPPNISSLSAYSQLLLDRDRRLSLVLESAISDAIQADPTDQGIGLAVGWVWPDYRPGSKWAPLERPNSRWLSCTTAPTAKQCSQVVHLNLLDGSLLVDGKPVGRLPNEIHSHPLYDLVFGHRVLEIMPSDLPGMDYCTRGRVSDHRVYFSLRPEDLVIRAIPAGSSEIVELIPSDKFMGDLPAILIEGHVHWLNLSTSVLEIRPLSSIWKSSPENWRIDCTPGRFCMHRSHEFLVDIRSNSWDMVSSILKPFESSQNLIVTVSSTGLSQTLSLPQISQLSVSLPRYGLSFYLDEDGDLHSHNIRGMVYDRNQSLGTFLGLVNRLVLRPKFNHGISPADLAPRCVLIPEGEVSSSKEGHHVRIKIDECNPTLHRLTYHTYRIDTDLGCLSGNTNLTDKLFCAYLHALTSGCGTDPLTGRSGTEEALALLRSAGVWSIMTFGPRDAELLCLIASICPLRTWYPKHLQKMQKVEWRRDLPVNSQHHGLYIVCKEIKEHYERVQLFYEGLSNPFGDFPTRNNHLLQRSASRRAAYLFPSDCSEQLSGTYCDLRYTARDLVEDGSGEHRAYTAATIVFRRRSKSLTNKDIVLNLLESWTDTIQVKSIMSLQYDKSWLAPDIPSIWLGIYDLLRSSGDEKKWFQLLFSLPAMTYASPDLGDLVHTFVAFATDSQFCSQDPPIHYCYNLSEGYKPSSTTLRKYVSDCAHPFEQSPECDTLSDDDENYTNLKRRQLQMYNDRKDADADAMVQRLLDAWPCKTPPSCLLKANSYDLWKLESDTEELLSRCYVNFLLKEHLTHVQEILNKEHAHACHARTPDHQYSFDPALSTPSLFSWSLTMHQLLLRPPPSLPARGSLPRLAQTHLDLKSTSLPGPSLLPKLVGAVESNAENEFQRRYASALRASTDHFKMSLGDQAMMQLPSAVTLDAYYSQSKLNFSEALRRLKNCLSPRNQSEKAVEQSGQWPRVTVHILFRILASNSPIVLSDDWKTCLIDLALLALELQRTRRLLQLRLDCLDEELYKELENEGCDGWNPKVHPDWLLIQLQGNLLVRRVQAEVANEMITPRSRSNTAMQLNMGEGKSSVIVPIVVADLADGEQLVRVIVPKALTRQMFHILADRLGGLVNRRIYFLPFSRLPQVNHQKIAALRDMMSECMKKRGILVVQPEHILSLRLVSVEKQLPEEKNVQLAHPLLELQRWLHSHARDILDESDEILHVRYQLVYTIGLQQHMEGFPERWTTTEQVLGLVSKHAFSLRTHFPLGVECECGPSGSFPHLRILHKDAGRALVTSVTQDIINGFLPNLSLGQLYSGLREMVCRFISHEYVSPETVRLVQTYSQGTPLWSGLLLLRGLLATGILLYAFRERRWRVDYGLAPTRTMLAVPYRAKDVPSQRAEFGHPDVAIILTCLSYYYGGLTEEQLRLSFEILLKQDDPILDYEMWIRDCADVPVYLRTLSGINIKSSEQWKALLFPLFSRNRATVDFYLSNVVFPKEAKEFPSKLSCSGWDLAEKKERLLTGFSGTNDGRYLLPLHIMQRDPDHQRGTNARVLSYLLQPENNHYMCMTHENGERRTTREFINVLVSQRPEIRVLLDVGAQMLDLQNYELAEAWLDVNPEVSAAIYFNEHDELMIRTRDGSIQPFLSSPFTQQLDQCVVYLDDAHTRGTDIKFPTGFRAAITLGPKVTKDRLTQGCMRMRKLGHGHSVMFFAPLEVDRCIRSVARKDKYHSINTMDILHWAIHETCKEIQQRAPHWAQQGIDHKARYSAWTSFCRGELPAETLSDKWCQPEEKRLEDLYAPQGSSRPDLSAAPDIRQHCVKLGVLSLRDVNMDEEQEREVIHEVEHERRVERPSKAVPACHSIHSDIVSLVETGVFPRNSHALRPAFETLDETSAITKEARVWSPLVLATADFQKTVSSPGKRDEYLRPVQWVVSTKRGPHEALVILSPYEVNQLMPRIRSSNNVRLHLYTPRVTRTMKPCDDLALYSMPTIPTGWTFPASLIDQLNVFAGQLYLKNYETYIRLGRFLCVYTRDLQDEVGIEVGCDGFIAQRTRPKRLRTIADTFSSSPISSLRVLMGLRRRGARFAPTHMGKLLDGRLLSEDDFNDSGDDDVRDPQHDAMMVD